MASFQSIGNRIIGSCPDDFAFGCSPIYVLRAAYEEGKILWRRQTESPAYIQQPDVNSTRREKLKNRFGRCATMRATCSSINVGGQFTQAIPTSIGRI
jgi:hypothetical protein